jgi:ketosteroid isomerase-like protein
MKRTIFLLFVCATLSTHTTNAQETKEKNRIAELDAYWAKLSKTVQEGDFKGYASLYHPDAVVVFTSGKNKTSMPVADALAGWKKGFTETKAGNRKDSAEFRFSQRIGNETTAHETGIFIFTSKDRGGKVTAKYITHFEMLLVKRNGTWYGVMEYQKSNATEAEWEALK